MPHLGSAYDSTYAAARPLFDYSVVYAGNYGIYYTVDDERKEVYIRYVEDQRRDSRKWFIRSSGA